MRSVEMRRARWVLMTMAFGGGLTYYCGRTWYRLSVDRNWSVGASASANVGEEKSANGEQGGCYWMRNCSGLDEGGCIYVKASEQQV
jgi:hypothetical protein